MARSSKRSRVIIVKLVSTALTGVFYPASKPRTAPKMAMMKYDKVVNRHVLFTEVKISKK